MTAHDIMTYSPVPDELITCFASPKQAVKNVAWMDRTIDAANEPTTCATRLA